MRARTRPRRRIRRPSGRRGIPRPARCRPVAVMACSGFRSPASRLVGRRLRPSCARTRHRPRESARARDTSARTRRHRRGGDTDRWDSSRPIPHFRRGSASTTSGARHTTDASADLCEATATARAATRARTCSRFEADADNEQERGYGSPACSGPEHLVCQQPRERKRVTTGAARSCACRKIHRKCRVRATLSHTEAQLLVRTARVSAWGPRYFGDETPSRATCQRSRRIADEHVGHDVHDAAEAREDPVDGEHEREQRGDDGSGRPAAASTSGSTISRPRGRRRCRCRPSARRARS